VLFVTLAGTSFFGMMASVCGNAWSYGILRVLLGIFLGGIGPTAVSLLIEFTPSYCRGYATGISWIGYYAGEVIGVLLGWGFHWGSDENWRDLVLVVSAIPLLIFPLWALGLVDIPESPRYLLISGRQQQGWDALANAAQQNRSIMFKQKLIATTSNRNWIECTSQAKRGSIRDLFHPTLWLTTVLLWIIWFVAGYGMYGMLFLVTRFFHRKTHLSTQDEHFAILLTSVGAVIGVFLGTILSEVRGRKPAFIVGFGGAGVFVMLLNMKGSIGVILFIAALVRFFVGMYEAVWYTYTPEVYPTSVRQVGVGCCSMFAKLAGMVSPVVSELVMSGPVGSGATYRATGLSMAAFFIGAVAAVSLPLETRGRGLQDFVGDEQGGQEIATDAWSWHALWGGIQNLNSEEAGLLEEDNDGLIKPGKEEERS